ncbi:MAG: PAS domain-containing protein [Planctomycetes bacterium]|nr:PAS domain-containing protein [Planctomycetota bacterium]
MESTHRSQHDPHARSAAEAERHFQRLFDSLDAVVFEFDVDQDRFVFVSAQAERILGYPREDWLRPGFWAEHLHPDDRDESMRFCTRAVDDLRNHEFEYRMHASDGRVVWIRDTVTVSPRADRSPLLTGVMVDVSARKRAELAGAELQQRLRTLVELLPIGVLFEDPERRIRIANPELCRIFGVRDGTSVIGLTCLEALQLVQSSFAEPARAVERIEAIFQRDEPVEREMVEMSGARAIERSYVPVRVEGRISGYLWLYEDVTSRRRAEHCIREISAGTSAAVGDAFYRELVGHLASALGLRYAIVGQYSDLACTHVRSLAVWIDGRIHDNFEYDVAGSPCEIAARDGHVRIDGDLQERCGAHPVIRTIAAASYIGVHVRSADGQAAGILAVLHDTVLPDLPEAESILRIFVARVGAELERQHALRALQASEARARALIQAHPDELFLLDRELRVVAAHIPEGARMSLDAGALLGRAAHEVLPLALSEPLAALARAAQATRAAQHSEFQAELPWGIRQLELRAHPVDEQLSLLLVRDVTERRRLEAEIAQAQRMDSLGRLAGGVAHDFNNLLTGILSYAEIGESDADDAARARECFQRIGSAARTASQLTQQLLALARKQVALPKVVEVDELVREVEAFLGRVLGEHIELEAKLGASGWCTRVDPAQFHQVLMNLALNARDALPEGGRIAIETRNVAASASPSGLAARDWIQMSVIDQGVGMSSATLAHLFEPFFTTKPMGRGTGIGLALSRDIVRHHGGQILVASEVGRGTRVDVYWPRTEAGAAQESRGGQAPARGDETLLLVEDEASLQNVLGRSLEQLGYRVLAAGSAEVALELTLERLAEIDLVVTDIVLPKMGGPELVERLRSRRPNLPVLFMTGYAPDEDFERVMDHEALQLLRKPFTPNDLARKVRDVLRARTRA